jgi:hypothetical protein
LTPGEIVLNRRQQLALLNGGVGGGGNTYNVVINTQQLDAKKLKRELDRMTARR